MAGNWDALLLTSLLVHAVYGFLQGYAGGAATRFLLRHAAGISLRLFVDLGLLHRRRSLLRVAVLSLTYTAAAALGIVLTFAPMMLLFSLTFLPKHRHLFNLWLLALAAGVACHQIRLQRHRP